MASADDRTGLPPDFLGAHIDLPAPTDPAVPTVRLDYVHFSVLMRPDRRMAAVAAVGIDGATLQDLPREGIDWRLDDRIPADQQTGADVYANNDLDRGHLVRRADAVWGATRAEAQAGNVDTFHYTNAAPQAARFNQGDDLWLGLETYLLDHAATYDQRLVVLTGPVFDPADPTYRGVQIPLRFYKVAVFVLAPDATPSEPPALGATGYVLDQTPQVADLPDVLARAREVGAPPPLGPFRTFQVPITDIAELTGLDWSTIAPLDRLLFAAASPQTAPAPWRPLRSYADIVL